MRLSGKGAELRPAAPLPPLSNVKMWFGDAQGDGPAGDVYAKVVDESSGATPTVIVRFCLTRHLMH